MSYFPILMPGVPNLVKFRDDRVFVLPVLSQFNSILRRGNIASIKSEYFLQMLGEGLSPINPSNEQKRV